MSETSQPKILKPVRILGIDPGSRLLGYGVVDVEGREIRVVDFGTLKIFKNDEEDFGQRLLRIHQLLTEMILSHRPEEAAFENVFFAKNAVSALKLGQARGAAILSTQIHGVKFFEYSSTEVKQTVTGYGRADKDQVAAMVTAMTGYKNFETADSSDGLAIALCHAMHRASSGRRPPPVRAKKTARRVSLADAVAHAQKKHTQKKT